MRILSIFLLIVSMHSMSAQGGSAEDKAKGMIITFFEGFNSGDLEKMKSVMAPEIIMQRTFTDQQGVNRVVTSSGNDIIESLKNKPSDQKWEEKILGFRVSFDGNLAHVWTPYEFWLNDKFSHCGANSFTLARTQNGWRIVHLIDSRRRDGCRS